MKRAMLAFVFLASCAGHKDAIPAIDDLERARQSAQAKESAKLAPQAYAEAEQYARDALALRNQGDNIGAALAAERAMAAHQRAFALARLARANSELTSAQEDLTRTEGELRSLSATRAEVTRDGDELEKKIKIAQESRLPPPSGPADATREAARLVAARSLAVQARLLCSAAHLIVPTLTGLKEAEDATSALEKKLEGTPKPAPIDEASQRRVACLDLLTKARRTSDGQSGAAADALLSELSAASWSPTRDERGVVVTLHDVFAGNTITSAMKTKLEDLGKISRAHPNAWVQVVVHDALESKDGQTRVDAVTKTLTSAGAPADKVKGESAGTKNPIVDPQDAKNRARNARVEIVFVTK